jgi:hypothetical protein
MGGRETRILEHEIIAYKNISGKWEIGFLIIGRWDKLNGPEKIGDWTNAPA